MMTEASFSILITTKNRKNVLAFTLDKIKHLLERKDVICIICDDGSTDGTTSFLQANYPFIQLIQNAKSEGLIFSRNRLLNLTKTEFAVSIDDDAHFITERPLESIKVHFDENVNCGLIALRIFWGLDEPIKTECCEKSHQVQGFIGCAHIWRMCAWRDIPNYPAWFVFYGEEEFASYQLFKKNWEIHYFPEVLVHHRVDVKARRNNPDYILRLRRSLRAGWYLFFLFYPIAIIPKKIAYSLWMQFKLKVFKGDLKALQAICLALMDLVGSIPKIVINSNRLTQEEYEAYQKLPETKIYWQLENNQK
ncbi:glycosyltransferase [Flavobacterium gawalongense]|uniref:Glycosyltransferase n=1 Tax=Flavobacterium gawalongense TaxID=2594432 RepID=A0A553BYS6_9FLAO|nr:glycosyltransferase [Flavobacterium gawalongense]TRX13482.1 glycosyltransferase [Flavobacterium gawalongense]TRX15586.1 glycosyltransferase [Flavobacterium gawalongense]TRX31424.1 glycosyltransferase [Flavobacterium gawalongense]